jgi:murein DD-endopeptidase MepM/ murein hydrolase activator NlpD
MAFECLQCGVGVDPLREAARIVGGRVVVVCRRCAGGAGRADGGERRVTCAGCGTPIEAWRARAVVVGAKVQLRCDACAAAPTPPVPFRLGATDARQAAAQARSRSLTLPAVRHEARWPWLKVAVLAVACAVVALAVRGRQARGTGIASASEDTESASWWRATALAAGAAVETVDPESQVPAQASPGGAVAKEPGTAVAKPGTAGAKQPGTAGANPAAAAADPSLALPDRAARPAGSATVPSDRAALPADPAAVSPDRATRPAHRSDDGATLRAGRAQPAGFPMSHRRGRNGPTHGGAVFTYPLPAERPEEPMSESGRFGAFRTGRRAGDCGEGHCGVDLSGTEGVPVLAARTGEVAQIWLDPTDLGGVWIRLAHDDGMSTWYMHLDRVRPDLKPGDRVAAGEVVALLGRTGVKDSPTHLHFAITIDEGDGRLLHVDPQPYLQDAATVAPAELELETAPGPADGFEAPAGQARR